MRINDIDKVKEVEKGDGSSASHTTTKEAGAKSLTLLSPPESDGGNVEAPTSEVIVAQDIDSVNTLGKNNHENVREN